MIKLRDLPRRIIPVTLVGVTVYFIANNLKRKYDNNQLEKAVDQSFGNNDGFTTLDEWEKAYEHFGGGKSRFQKEPLTKTERNLLLRSYHP